jgi:hypothetical protein
MSSSEKHLGLSTQMIVVSMFLNVLLGDVEERIDKIFGNTWTLVM